MTAFWDASAIVPLCVPWQGGTQGRQLLAKYDPVVWWATPVEISSAVSRLQRHGQITEAQARMAAIRLDSLRRTWREVTPTDKVRDLALSQIDLFGLRAGDALQLAAALDWCNGRPRRRHFICNDLRLRAAAGQTGFNVLEY